MFNNGGWGMKSPAALSCAVALLFFSTRIVANVGTAACRGYSDQTHLAFLLPLHRGGLPFPLFGSLQRFSVAGTKEAPGSEIRIFATERRGGETDDGKRRRRSSANLKETRKDVQDPHSNPTAGKEDEDDLLCLRFSRSFQRHVIYRPRRGRFQCGSGPSGEYDAARKLFCRFDDICGELIESFPFLDEAIEAYPTARVVTFHDAAVATRSPPQIEEEKDDNCQSVLAGVGLRAETAYKEPKSSHSPSHETTATPVANQTEDTSYDSLRYLSSLAWSCGQTARSGTLPDSPQAQQELDDIASALAGRVGKGRLGQHTPQSIRRNYNRVMDLLTRGRARNDKHGVGSGSIGDDETADVEVVTNETSSSLNLTDAVGLAFSESGARRVVSNFPQLCLYEFDELEERVRFFMAPRLPPAADENPRTTKKKSQEKGNKKRGGSKSTETDWALLSWKGYGAGLTISQTTEAINALPQLLAMHHEDARKPSVILYFYQQLEVSYKLCDEARVKLADHLTGADPADVCTFAYLRSLGVEWEQMQLLLDAFPTLTFCDLEPSWEIEGPVRSVLKEPVVHYLRKRLQVGPREIVGMMKTHSRLSTYSLSKIVATLDALEYHLGFSSRELRKVILRMPSQIGMAVGVTNPPTGMNKRLHFFLEEAGMDHAELRQTLLRQPSLLQYSVEQSLMPKLRFLVDELSISPSSLSRIIRMAPSLLGLSLSHNIRPKVAVIMYRCGLSSKELGAIVTAVPTVLTLSLSRKVDPCLAFLSESLGLSSTESLGQFIMRSPRVLLHGVESSLAPKLRMTEDALGEKEWVRGKATGEEATEEAARILTTNPALLLTTKKILRMRLKKCLNDAKITSLSEALRPSGTGPKRKAMLPVETKPGGPEKREKKETSKKQSDPIVLEISTDSKHVIRVYPSAREAAQEVKVSERSFYDACVKGELLEGRKFACAGGELPNMNAISAEPRRGALDKTTNRASLISYSSDSVVTLGREPLPIFDGLPLARTDSSSGIIRLVIFASGRVFPTDDSNVVRGTRRAGGIALYFPQVRHGASELSKTLRVAAESSFGTIMPEVENGSSYENGLILAGFPFLRPSRNRCDLYACHDALKVVLQLLKKAATRTDLRSVDFNITICTDSSYVWKLLHDEARLFQWGAFPSMDEFVYNGDGPLTHANPDLLYPLARTYHRLVTADVYSPTEENLCIGNAVDISFEHVCSSTSGDAVIKGINDYSRKAASWQFNRAQRT